MHRCPEPTHLFQVGDKVVIKVLPRSRKPGDFVFGPETTVVAVTRTAILTDEGPTWIHASRVKKVPLKDPSVQDTEVLTRADSPDLQQDKAIDSSREEDVGELWALVDLCLPTCSP